MSIPLSYAAADSATMLRRNLRHLLRYPSMTIMVAGLPVLFLLIFVYVFGGILGAGLGHGGGRAAYLAYVTPGIVLLSLYGSATATAVSVAMDMTQGIVARFRTMAIARSAVLTGHVLGSVIQGLLGCGVVLGVALAIGFRPAAGPLAWLGVAGTLAMIVFAFTWLSVVLGLVARTPEEASNTPTFLMVLGFLGSGFVPTGSMPAALRWFAEYQPFTPVTQTLRALLLGTPVGNNAIIAVAWCAGLTAVSYVLAIRLFRRDLRPVAH
ncbi:MAG TPA: ABC transporter permease [Streptosporangiaceae bacterium]|jgi:ABC-2 type transport system permease protein